MTLRPRLRHLPHLTRRFFTSLPRNGPGPRGQSEAAGLLRPSERALFWSQPAMDQRHGIDSARRALAAAPGRRDLARAALLHDVGKRHARLGVLRRSLVSGLALLRLPVGERGRRYLDHGRLGAADLAAVGAEPLVVGYAEHHHGGRPGGVAVADWALLQRADDDA